MKKIYLTPEVEWLIVAVEQGFAATPNPNQNQNQDFVEDPNETVIG